MKNLLKIFFTGLIIVTLMSACAGAGAELPDDDTPIVVYNAIAQGLGDYDEASALPTTEVEALTTLGMVGFVAIQTFIAATDSVSPYANWSGLADAIIADNLTYSSSTVSYDVVYDSASSVLNATADIDDTFDLEAFDFGPGAPVVTGTMDVFLDANITAQATSTALIDVNGTSDNTDDDVLLPTAGTATLLLTANIGCNNVNAGDAFKINDGYFHFNTDLATNAIIDYTSLPPNISVDYDGTITLTFAVSVTSGTFVPHGGKYVLVAEFNNANTISIDLATFDPATDMGPLLTSLSSSLSITLDICKNDGEIVNTYAVSIADIEAAITAIGVLIGS